VECNDSVGLHGTNFPLTPDENNIFHSKTKCFLCENTPKKI
jgi:hypothetical protein